MNKKAENLLFSGWVLVIFTGIILSWLKIEPSIYLVAFGMTVYFAAFAFIHLSGNEILIAPKYRGTESARVWQKGRGFVHLLLGCGTLVGAGLIWYDNQSAADMWIGYLIWFLIMGGLFVWHTRIDRKFSRTLDSADRPWLMR